MAAKFRIEFSPSAKSEFDAVRIFDQRRILNAMETKLTNEPSLQTHDKKCLGNEPANFAYAPPLWQLRVDDFRVFYEVNVEDGVVSVLAVRRKPATKTTSEVLNEADGD